MSLSPFDYVVVGGATLVAGAVNALAGGGTLISFPTLVAVGVPSLPANVTNTVALCPGYLSGTLAQRQDLAGQRTRATWLAVVAGAGGLIGSALLEVTPEATFRAVVPYLLVLSCVLLLGQDRVRSWVRARSERRAGSGSDSGAGGGAGVASTGLPGGERGAGNRATAWEADPAPAGAARPPFALQATVLFGAIYGGFFGAGLGIMVLALLGLFLDDTLVRVNAVKQLLQFVINVFAAALFAVSGHVRWELVPVMGVAGLVGGALGGRLVRVVNPTWLRRFVVAFGLVVAIDFWLTK